jgi:hypothetical protein
VWHQTCNSTIFVLQKSYNTVFQCKSLKQWARFVPFTPSTICARKYSYNCKIMRLAEISSRLLIMDSHVSNLNSYLRPKYFQSVKSILTQWGRFLLKKLNGLQLIKKNSTHFMEPDGSLPHSQVPSTCLYPEPAQFSPHLTSHFLKIHLNTIHPSTPGSSQWLFSFRFPHQKLCTCFSPSELHVSPIYFSILSPAQYSHTPSAYVPPSVPETMLHIHIK